MNLFRLAARSKFVGTAPLYVLALVLILLACSTDRITTTQQPTPDDLLPVVDNPEFIRYVGTDAGKDTYNPQLTGTLNNVASGVVGVDGGTITNGIVTLVFPNGALSDDTAIQIEMIDEQLLIFELTPHGIQFDQPVKLMVSLEHTDAAASVDASSLIWYDEFGNVWKLLPTTATDGRTMETDLMHFSKFGGVNG
jgi:hypothetical protein